MWMPLFLLTGSLFLSFEHLSSLVDQGKVLSPQIQEFQNQSVQVKGFLYHSLEDQIILAARPNLKSCCIGKGAQWKEQIRVKGELGSFPQQGMATLEGIFIIDPRYDETGQLMQLYVLEQARIISQRESERLPWRTLSLLSLFMCLLVGLFRWMYHRIKSI